MIIIIIIIYYDTDDDDNIVDLIAESPPCKRVKSCEKGNKDLKQSKRSVKHIKLDLRKAHPSRKQITMSTITMLTITMPIIMMVITAMPLRLGVSVTC